MDISSMMSAGSSGRITGLATGMDTDQLIKDMLKGEMAKGDKIYQDKAYLELRQQSYREIIKGLKEFQKYFDSTSDKYLSFSDFNTSKTTLSNEKYFSATASTSAANGTYKVTVNNLAEAAKHEGSSVGGVYALDDTTKNKKFDVVDTNGVSIGKINMDGSNNITLDASLDGKINIKTYEKDGKTFVKVENISSDALKIDYDGIGVGEEPKELVNLSNDTKLTQLGIAEGKLSFDINGSPLELTVGPETKISDLKSEISKVSGGKVTIELDENLNKINFVSTSTGSESRVDVTNMSVKDSGGLELQDDAKVQNVFGFDNGVFILGKDAQVELTMPDGLKTTATSSTNKISEFGLTLDLKQADAAQEIEVSVDKKGSVDDSVDKIKNFIKDYNAIVGAIHDKLTEKKSYSYKPLTEEQKKSMKEDDVKNWNTKVKQGILSNDPLLEKMLSDLRSSFGTAITGADAKFGDYGENTIGLDYYSDYKRSGQVELDEKKLKEVLGDSPKLIEDFFTSVSEKTLDADKVYIGSDKFKEDGAISRINTILKEYIGMPGMGDDGKSTLKGSMNIFINKQYDYSMTGSSSHNTLPDQMYRKQKSLELLQQKIFKKQESLYLQFSKLETAMNKLNAQSSQMMSQFGGM